MITSAENYTKKNKQTKKTDRQSPWTNGKSKGIQTNSHKEAYTYTQKEKMEKYIYIVAPKVYHLNFGMIRYLFKYSRDAGHIKLIVEI